MVIIVKAVVCLGVLTAVLHGCELTPSAQRPLTSGLCLLQVVMQNVEAVQHLGGSLVEMAQNSKQHRGGQDEAAHSSSSNSSSDTPLQDAALHQQQRIQHQSAAGLTKRNPGNAQEQLQMHQLPKVSSSMQESEKDA